MSDDFGTIGVGGAGRDIEALKRHREMLATMIAEAPNVHLEGEYRRLLREIDTALTRPTSPGMRPLVTTKLPDSDVGEPRSRVPLIILAAILTLALIGALIWYASSDRKPDDSVVVEDTSATTGTTTTKAPPETGTVVPIHVAAAMSVSPPANDYGVIRKGTRATRQFEVTNRGDGPVTMVLARSKCRCLFYEYHALIPSKGKESVTVTIDGARAKPGEVRETIKITSKSDPSVGTSFDVIATIQ